MKLFRKKKESPYWKHELAVYNSERSRGILHSPAWTAKMKIYQELFNENQWCKVAGLNTKEEK